MPKVKKVKIDKKPTSAKSVNVNVSVPLTGTSFMSVLLIALLALIGYSGYLGVKSVWDFTHPKINISLDGFKVLGYAAQGTEIPSLPFPTFTTDTPPDSIAQENYLKAIDEFRAEFRIDFPKSRLLDFSNNAILGMGDSFCKAKEESMQSTQTYSAEEIILAHQAKFVLRYPRFNGLSEFLQGVGQRSFDHLCKGN